MDGSVGVSGGVVVSVGGVDIGDDLDLFERPLKRERNMEDNVLYRMLETFDEVDVCWGEGSAVAVAFVLISLSG
jgi:hypothetical protein